MTTIQGTVDQNWAKSWPGWLGRWLAFGQAWVALPPLLVLILVIDVTAYFAGLLYWYGYVMAEPSTPWWAWPFIPDCPLFGLLGGLGLLMVTAQNHWTSAARARGQRWLAVVAVASLLTWLSTYLPNATTGWRQQSALFAVWSWSLLLAAIYFRRPPVWLLGLFAFGQIKYGIWTITAWLLYWQSTAAAFGAPHFSFDSVFMTLTHIGLVGQGVFLLTYFRPTPAAALAGLLWFGASDFVDYGPRAWGLGFYPAIPEQFIALPVMQWSTVTVTLLLSSLFLWLGMMRPKAVHLEPRPGVQFGAR